MTRRALTPLSYLDAPLDELLGQVSHVRILRVLANTEHPLPPGELARVTQLNLSGVLRAIDRLTKVGIVRSLGAGGRRVIELSLAHPFAPVLRALFDAERQRRRLLLDALRELIASAPLAPRAAWIEGPHASGTDTAHDTLRLGVLTTARERHAVAEQLASGIRQLERRFDLTIDLLVRTRADVETMTPEQQSALREATLLHGVSPLVEPRPQDTAVATTHADLDAQSGARATRVAQAITRDPRLIADAQRWVQHRLRDASAQEAHELREWEHILTLPPHRIAAFVCDPGERATRLRQTSPFIGLDRGDARGARRK
jgi:DNA-binding MarR family transcriptional regulator